MSRRPFLKPQTAMNTLSLGADAYSIISWINQISMFSYTIVWTGTPTGQFYVEVCDDYVPNPQDASFGTPVNPGTWVPLILSAGVVATGSAGSAFIDVDACSAAFCRLHYVFSSGTGTATAVVAGKVT